MGTYCIGVGIRVLAQKLYYFAVARLINKTKWRNQGGFYIQVTANNQKSKKSRKLVMLMMLC